MYTRTRTLRQFLVYPPHQKLSKSMEAPIRFLNLRNLSRQFPTIFFLKPTSISLLPPSSISLSPTLKSSLSLSSTSFNNSISLPPLSPFLNSSQLGFFLSLSSSDSHHFNNPNHLRSNPNNGQFFNWHRASAPLAVFPNSEKCEVAAVILGWLGAMPKHLRRYAEMYTSRGIDAITFVVPVRDVLWFDLGNKVENRIKELADELVSWLSNANGRKRCLIFHTFSNTGWLVYGAILAHLQDRPDLIESIRGCIVDSGGDPELNPKVWAAGFAAALLKKRNTAISSSSEDIKPCIDKNKSKFRDEDPYIMEALVLAVLEKMFTFLLKLPDVNQRLSRIISQLSDNQPNCPQLYLYSTADKVIPYQSIESFIEQQKMKGRSVWSFNFRSSPHVDHYRTFPDVYTSHIKSFLNVSFQHI